MSVARPIVTSRERLLTPLAALALAVTTATMIALDVQSPVRVVLILAATLVVPGALVVTALRPLEPALRWTVILAGSVSVNLLAALVSLLIDRWAPVPTFMVVLCASAVGLCALLVRSVLTRGTA